MTLFRIMWLQDKVCLMKRVGGGGEDGNVQGGTRPKHWSWHYCHNFTLSSKEWDVMKTLRTTLSIMQPILCSIFNQPWGLFSCLKFTMEFVKENWTSGNIRSGPPPPTTWPRCQFIETCLVLTCIFRSFSTGEWVGGRGGGVHDSSCNILWISWLNKLL